MAMGAGRQQHTVKPTKVAGWFVRLSLLQVPAPDDWTDAGSSHASLAAWYLCDAIEAMIATGNRKLHSERELRQSVEQLGQECGDQFTPRDAHRYHRTHGKAPVKGSPATCVEGGCFDGPTSERTATQMTNPAGAPRSPT